MLLTLPECIWTPSSCVRCPFPMAKQTRQETDMPWRRCWVGKRALDEGPTFDVWEPGRETIRKELHPGRLTAGTYSHHPWKERKMIWKQTSRELWSMLIFAGCIRCSGWVGDLQLVYWGYSHKISEKPQKPPPVIFFCIVFFLLFGAFLDGHSGHRKFG